MDRPAQDGHQTRRSRSRVRVRHVATVLHRYVGLAISGFLIIAAVTGSIITFHHELDEWVSPQLFKAEAPTPSAPLLDPFEIRERLLEQLPAGTHIERVKYEVKHGETVNFWVQGAGSDDTYFVNPYTGKIQGSRDTANLSQGTQNIVPFIYRLHYRLGLGYNAYKLMGIVALLWTLDCFVGAYLTLPTGGLAQVRKRRWWTRWKSSWLFKSSPFKALVFTWHRAAGLWVWVMLFVFALSAVALILPELYDPITGHTNVHKATQGSVAPVSEPAVSFRSADALGEEFMSQIAADEGFEVIRKRRLTLSASQGYYVYEVVSTRDVAKAAGRTRVFIDATTGKQLAYVLPTGQRFATTFRTWIVALHFASVGGTAMKLFVSLMGIVVTLLTISGILIWSRKQKARLRRVFQTLLARRLGAGADALTRQPQTE